MSQSWGVDLWDQFDNIALETQKGIDFGEKYGNFIREKAKIEKEYANNLRRLYKSFLPKKKDEEDYQFTCALGFSSFIKEVNDMAGQHESIAENLTDIGTDLTQNLTDCKSERKKFLQEGSDHVKSLQNQLNALDKSKRQYEKAFKEMEKAKEAYQKAYDDINLSRAEVEKAKNICQNKQQTCEAQKNEYASELQKTNEAQKLHYTQEMPTVFQNLQNLDENRVTRLQQFIIQSADVERKVVPIINTCIDGIHNASQLIDAKQDTAIIIDRYKSGLSPPGDIPFEDLSSNGNTAYENHNHVLTPKDKNKGDTIKGTISGGKGKKRTNIFQSIFSHSKGDDSKEDYSHLPPNQQKRKLTQKHDNLKQMYAKDEAERQALQKMRDVYVQNPALGNPNSLDDKLDENAIKLDKYRQELKKYEEYLNEAENRLITSKHSLSSSDDSISRNMSEVSVSSNPSTPITQHQMKSSSLDNDANTRYRESMISEQDSFDDGLDDDFPVLGIATALYPFDAASEGAVDMGDGEEFHILEIDQGDGWTRVRKITDMDEGFVPTSYIRISLYED